MTAVGRGFTVIVADPVRSAGIAVQFASVSDTIVNVVELVGETVTLIGDELPLNRVPFDNAPFHGPVPVTTMLSVIDCPLQIVIDATIEAVGRALTVTVAEPLRSAGIAVQLASDIEATV
jgi:hypothetical protein